MKKHCKKLWVMLLSLVLLLEGCVPSAKPYLAEDRNQKWINDIAYTEKVLPKVHKNLFFSLTKEEFIIQMEALKQKVPNYSDEEIEVELSKIIASAGDTHTGSGISSEVIYPFELHWFKEGIYITGTNKENAELLDAKILTLNGQKIEDAANKIRPLLKGANESWFKTQVVYYLPIKSVLNYFDITKQDEIELEAELATGKQKKIKMKPIYYKDYVAAEAEKKPLPLYKTHPNENYWYEYLQDKKVLYINYSSCRQMREKPFEIFSNEVWDFIKQHEVEKLILDMRENRGGRSPILTPFIKKIKKSRFNAEGKFYVVIGKDTYSSAVLNVAADVLKKGIKANLVGENTGGSPNHYGEIKQFELPNSKWNIRYSTKYFRYLDEEADTIKPDKVIEESFQDYQKGEDPVLQWILK